MIEYTLSEKPRSQWQRYQLRNKGTAKFANLKSEDAARVAPQKLQFDWHTTTSKDMEVVIYA